jgi:adenosylmethionine-8-amino-7-oxononanoate aminotransferase
MIFDEIITGIGRTGQMFAAQTFGVTPDVICTGKGLSGGFVPLSAMICRKPIADVFWGPIETNPGFVEGHTWEGGPVACAAGIAIIEEILERDLCRNSREQGARLRTAFEYLAEKHGVIGDIRGRGLFQAIEFVADRQTKAQFPAKPGFGVRVGRLALERGLLCRFDPHWIAFGPALTVTGDELDAMVGILDECIGAILAE